MTKPQSELLETIRTILVDQLAINESEITPEKTLVDLGADSLDELEITMAIEDEYNFEFPDGEFEKLATVADIVADIEKRLAATA